MPAFSHNLARPLTVTESRRAWIIILTVISVVALVFSTVAVPRAEAQPQTQPENQPANSRSWNPAIPFAPGAKIVDNPAEKERCGQNIALVFDLSTSIGAEGLTKSKEAGTKIVDALDTTPTHIGIYNFGTVAPAGGNGDATVGIQERGSAQTLKDAINKMSLPATGVVGTNWDRGIGQIPKGTYDVVYFITDGLPTAFGEARGSGDRERGLYNRPAYNHVHNGKANKDFAAAKADVQEAVASANALKASGTRIVPLAVGNEVNQGVAPTYLNYISGEGDAISVSDYGDLADKLVEQATKACRGEVTIRKSFAGKSLVTEDGSANLGEGASFDGWKFSITGAEAEGGETITPLDTEVATVQGEATLRYVTSGPDTKGKVTINEADGKIEDVQCTDETGAKIEVSREGNTFKVPAKTGGKVSCKVQNIYEPPVPPTSTETACPCTTETVTTAVTTTETATTTVDGTPTTVTETKEVPTTVTTEVPTTVKETETTAVPTTVKETETTEVPTTITTTLTTTEKSTTTVEGKPSTVTSTKEVPTTITTTVPTIVPTTVKETETKEVPTTITTTLTSTKEVPTIIAGEPTTVTVTKEVPTTITTQVPTTVKETEKVTETEKATSTVTVTERPVVTVVDGIPTTVTVTQQPEPSTVVTTVDGTPTTVTVTETPAVTTVTETTTVAGTAGSSDAKAVIDRCFGNAVRSPLLYLIPLGILAQVGGKIVQPYIGAFQAQLDAYNAEIHRRIQEQYQLPDFGAEIGKRVPRNEQVDELIARVNEANVQLQQLAVQPEVQQLGKAAGVVLATVAAGAVLYDWCSNEPGKAFTAVGEKGDGAGKRLGRVEQSSL